MMPDPPMMWPWPVVRVDEEAAAFALYEHATQWGNCEGVTRRRASWDALPDWQRQPFRDQARIALDAGLRGGTHGQGRTNESEES